MNAPADPNADVIRRVDAIAGKVDELVEELVQLKSALVDVDLVPWLSYRLAVILSRVDHAGAEIVIQQARRLEAEVLAGQLAAFPEEELEADHLAEPFTADPELELADRVNAGPA